MTDRKKLKLHEVFEDSFDIKECTTKKFIKQKLNYIYNKPCSGKWMLADSPENIYIVPPNFILHVNMEYFPLLIFKIDGY